MQLVYNHLKEFALVMIKIIKNILTTKLIKKYFLKDGHQMKVPGTLLYELLFSVSSKGSFIYTIPRIGQHIPQPLLHQSWSTGWM